MLQFKFDCPNCKTALEAPPKLAAKKTTCPECGHKFTIPAWKCGKRSSRRPAGSSPKSSAGKGYGKAAILFVLAALVVIGIVLVKRAELPVKARQGKESQLSGQLEREMAEKERLARVAEQRAQELADLFNRAQTCQRQALSGELSFDQAFEVFDAVVPKLAETKYADEASALLDELEAARQEAVAKAKDALVKAAQPHIDTHDYDAAVDVYESYAGPFTPELLDFCTEQARKLREAATERHAIRRRFLSVASADLLERNIRSAQSLLEAVPQQQYLIDMAETLARLENLLNSLAEAFENKIGETITLTINGRKYDVTLLEVVDDTLLVATQQDGQTKKGKFPIVKLELEDHYQVLADEDLLAATIYAVGRSVSKRKFDQALYYIDKGGDEADVLRDYVVGQQRKTEQLAKLKTEQDEQTEEPEKGKDVYARDDPKIVPGASFRLSFPDEQKSLEGAEAGLAVRLPANYDTEKQYPLFLWLDGGSGGLGRARTDLVDPDKYICIGMPLFKDKRKVERETGIGKIHVRYDDVKVIWPIYTRMLKRLEELVPNIEKERGVAAGFSNGAHTIAILMTEEPREFGEYFGAFVFVEGGWMYKENSTFRRCPIIALGGDSSWAAKAMGFDGSSASTVESFIRKNTRRNLGKAIVMKGTGHWFNAEYIPEVKAWLKEQGF
jgi:hypothetical protein